MAVDNIPLGVTLNNPLNIRRTSDVWVGMDSSYAGPYCRFDAPEYCYRAGAIILRGYEHRGIHTIDAAIRKWAPRADGNPTDEYISNVSNWSGIGALVPTELVQVPILRSMTRQELGYVPYEDNTIEFGIELSKPET